MAPVVVTVDHFWCNICKCQSYIVRNENSWLFVHHSHQLLVLRDPWTCIWHKWTPCLYMWKKIYSNNFPRLPLINISVYISVKCMIYHFLHRTLNKIKNTHRFSLCNKARISWSRKRSPKQQLIQPINGVVSSIVIWLYIWQGKQDLEIIEAPLTVKIGRFI